MYLYIYQIVVHLYKYFFYIYILCAYTSVHTFLYNAFIPQCTSLQCCDIEASSYGHLSRYSNKTLLNIPRTYQ